MNDVTPIRKVGLPPRGKKARNDAKDLRRLRRDLLERSHGRCEAGFVLGCTGYGTQIHHVKRRSQGGKNTLEDCRFVCLVCHEQIHYQPEAAREFGLLAPKGNQ